MGITCPITLISPYLLTFITTLLSLLLTTNTKHQKIFTKLIHRDSIFSPSYNPKLTIEDRADRILKNSISRANFLQTKGNRNLVVGEEDDASASAAIYEADVLADNHLFLVNLSIGQPPIPQLLVMDTGSSLLWMQCKPCKTCFPQTGLLYDSSSSSSCTNISCHDPSCYYIPFAECDNLNNCIYESSYLDGSKSKGWIGTEQLTFQTHDEGIVLVPNIVFGCGQENKINKFDHESGVLGLGSLLFSIVHGLGLKFSYCIGSIRDFSYNFNLLSLGDGVLTEGDSTPLEEKNGLYYLILEGISVGEEKLNIDPDVFKRNSKGGGTMIDSGCELTFLHQVAYDALKNKVSNILDGFLKLYDNRNGWLCYQGKLSEELAGFPVVTFHFAEGADLVLDIESTFYQRDDNVLCMALFPDESNATVSIIGALAQQYHNVVYDLNEKKIYFQRIDCELLD